jgi:NTE family protein
VDNYRTAIVFQGGGALGAYECGVIKALYENRRNFTPAAVTGVSIGAINAAVLVGTTDRPVEALENLWRKRFTQSLPPLLRTLSGSFLTHAIEQSLSTFGNAGMYNVRPDFLLAPPLSTSIYDLEPLRRTLRELVDSDKLNRPQETRLMFGAVDVRTGEPKYFDNQRDRLGIEHVIASGSVPPAFPITQIDGASYWDGGLFQNTPLSSAINCLEQIPGDIRRELIVVELFPQSAPLPGDRSEVETRLGQLIFASKLNIDRKLFATINKTIEFIEKIKAFIPPEFQDEPAYRDIFQRHTKIDALTVVKAEFPEDRANASDFSQDTIDFRITAGYKDAVDQGIGKPHPV